MQLNDLSDDLLVAVLAAVDDTATLRLVARTCRRWAALARDRMELWSDVKLALPPKRSRGRDRRNSYTTPCALNTERLAAWLECRASAIASLEVQLLYPDAEALLAHLLPPLRPGLRRLVLRGNASDWPYMWVDWRWLAHMNQLESLEVWNALPGMGELTLPPSLTELIVDRVGEADPDTEGWDELPDCFSTLTALRKLTLGTAATYLLQAEEESAFLPLRAAAGLRELRLTEGALSAVPDVLTALSALTLLSFRGCDRLESFGELCEHKPDPFQPLRALTQLRFLDFARCALDRLPPGLACLPELRTLLLSDNRLELLPVAAPAASAAETAGAAAELAGMAGSSGSPARSLQRRQAQQQQQQQQQHGSAPLAAAGAAAVPASAWPPRLETLVLAGNIFSRLPAAALAACSRLAELDLSRCWQMQPEPAEWRALLTSLPHLRLLRHSCPLLAAEERGHGSGANLAAAVGGSPHLRLDFLSSSVSRHSRLAGTAGGSSVATTSTAAGGSGAVASGSKRARSCGSLQELEAAAATLLGTGIHSGMRATLAELAATASSGSNPAAVGVMGEGGKRPAVHVNSSSGSEG